MFRLFGRKRPNTMFYDTTTVKLGEETITVRRTSLDELRNGSLALLAFIFEAKQCLHPDVVKFVKEHCTTEDGRPVDAGSLSFPQMQTLAREIGGVPEKVPFADFIALLL